MTISLWVQVLRACGFGLLGALLLPAQSELRAAGWIAFDTEHRSMPATQISASRLQTLILGVDGVLRASGRNQLCINRIPALPSGVRPVDICITPHGGAVVLSDGTIRVWGLFPSSAGYTPLLQPPPAPLPGTFYQKVTRSSHHGIAIRSDGELVCWGLNAHGECNPPPFPPGATPVAVHSSSRNSYAIFSDGSCLAWGENSWGQLTIPPLPPGVGWVEIRRDVDHVVALRSDGWIEAWGDNSHGQCNVPPLPPGTRYLAFSAGHSFTCASRSDGALLAWGFNNAGQCDPPTLPPGVFAIQLASGQSHTVALLSNGRVIDWGPQQWFGMAGVPTREELALPGQPAPKFRQVNRGMVVTVGVLDDGRFFGFGANDFGIGSVPSQLRSVRWQKVENQFQHTAGLTVDGQVHCWGINLDGRCDTVPLPPGLTYTDVTLSSNHTVALRSDGQAIGWGSTNFQCRDIPPAVPPLRYTAIAAELRTTSLLRSDGAIVRVGTTINNSILPQTFLPPPGLEYTGVATSQDWSLGLLSDGTVVRFGIPSGFPIGSQPPHYKYREIPPLPPGLYYVQISGGDVHGALRRSDGQLFAVGFCDEGQDYIPPLDPNTSYVHASASYSSILGRVGPTRTYIGFAPGCAGSRPATRLVPRDTPHIGGTFELRLFDLPVDVAMLAMGWQRLPAPLDLTSLGMPGCDWHVPLDGVALLAGSNHQAKFTLPIPDAPQLLGVRFYHQALVLDPNAPNALGVVASDAAEGVVGDH